MNCVNHPDVPVSAYCQNCGKALCAACVRQVAGVVYCEQCLAERLGMGVPGVVPPGPVPGVPPMGVIAPNGPSPGMAFGLGFIPGVGAFYNGQFLKGIIHVTVFAILIGLANQNGIFGVCIAGWVAYQVFDAYHTARARRDGLPLPDPFGLNDLGSKIGFPGPPGGHHWSPPNGPVWTPPPPPGSGFPPPPAAGFTPVAGFAPEAAVANDPFAPVPPVPPVGFEPLPPMPPPPMPPPMRRHEPVGAIVLIGLGVLFLLNTLNVFHFDVFRHLWPLLLIGFGAVLFAQRSRQVPPPMPPQPPTPPPPPTGDRP